MRASSARSAAWVSGADHASTKRPSWISSGARLSTTAARAIARVRKGGDRLGEAAAYRAIALLAERHADRSRADRYLARAYRSAAIRHSAREAAMTDQVGAQLAARRGDDDRAASLARGAATAFEAMGAASLGARANLARYQSLTRTISEAGKA